MEKKKSFEIHKIESPDQDNILRTNDSFNIIWFTGGEGNFIMDFAGQAIEPNTVFVLRPGQSYCWSSKRKLSGYFTSFTFDFIYCDEQGASSYLTEVFFDMILRRRTLKVDKTIQKEMLQLAEYMMKEFANVYQGRVDVLRGLLKLFIIYLTRPVERDMQPEKSLACVRLTRNFFHLVENNYKTWKHVVDYADDLCVTPNYLNSIVKEASGLSASYHINQRIILEAKRKAVHVNLSMKETAYYLGFEDLSHFSRFFKKGAGLNFSDFKKHAVALTNFG